MSRDKQIEEMASIINLPCSGHCEECPSLDCGCLEKLRAVSLYNAGYRKSTDLAEEIFAEIEKMLLDNHIGHYKTTIDTWCYNFNKEIISEIAELKKKYTEKESK